MKLLLCTVLLASLCCPSSWSVSSTDLLDVIQTPDVSVVEGETVNISCCWKKESKKTKVTWMKNETHIKEDTVNHSQGCEQKEPCQCSYWTKKEVTREDSGRYVCNVTVEIPILGLGKGNGTVITVTARVNTTGGPTTRFSQSPLVVSLAVVAPLLLVSLSVCFFCLRTTQDSTYAARVIYEVPHTDSEVEMDKHSTSSSRGSSQWCQVTVYESFDYFERVVTKEDG